MENYLHVSKSIKDKCCHLIIPKELIKDNSINKWRRTYKFGRDIRNKGIIGQNTPRSWESSIKNTVMPCIFQTKSKKDFPGRNLTFSREL